jgi:tetratricopeptide (TPR) repeat protein
LGNDQEALKYLKEIVSVDPSFDSPEVIETIFRESGIEGIIAWYIQWLQKNESLPFYYSVNLNVSIARLFAFIGDSQQAIASLEKAFEAGESSLPSIIHDQDFALLRDEPRFQAMLNEMGL